MGFIAVERFTEQPEGFYDAKKTDYLSLIELLFFEENFTSNVIRWRLYLFNIWFCPLLLT